MSDEWPADGFEREVAACDRLAVLYHAAPDADLVAAFAETGAFSSVPIARARLARTDDPRRAAMRLRALPAIVYYEHGEEMERLEPKTGHALGAEEVEAFFATIEEVQETWRVIRGRLRVDRFG